MSDFLTGSICLDDVPAEFKVVGKNGKTYVNFAISRRKEKSPYGETHTITVSKPKDQRKEGEGFTFIGGAKEWNGNTQSQTQQSQSTSANIVDDMPF